NPTPTSQPTVQPTTQPTVQPTTQPTTQPTVATPVSTDFQVNEVRIQAKDQPDSPALHSAKVGAKVFIYVYWTVKSLPDGEKPTYSYDAVGKAKGKTVAKGHDSFAGSKS